MRGLVGSQISTYEAYFGHNSLSITLREAILHSCHVYKTSVLQSLCIRKIHVPWEAGRSLTNIALNLGLNPTMCHMAKLQSQCEVWHCTSETVSNSDNLHQIFLHLMPPRNGGVRDCKVDTVSLGEMSWTPQCLVVRFQKRINPICSFL